MEVSGDLASAYNAIRLDSYAQVNDGKLKSANDLSGEVRWLDKTGEEKYLCLGSHMIRIVPRGHG